MKNIRILNYVTNKWITEEGEIKEVLKKIINNNSQDYSYNKNIAMITVKHFGIKV